MKIIRILPLLFLLYGCAPGEAGAPGKIYLHSGWKIQSSLKVKANGKEITNTAFDETGWYQSTVPSTVMGTLTNDSVFHDIFKSDNIKKVDRTQFDSSWWYRNAFQTPSPAPNQHVFLHFDGISYYANVWLNGKQIASKDSTFGVFRQFDLDVTQLVTRVNVLAVEIFKRKPGDFGLGFVDWNPVPPDENMGLWREVSLVICGDVRIQHPVVESAVNTQSLNEASLTIKTELTNYSQHESKGILKAKIDSIEFDFPISLKPHETKRVVLTEKDIPALHFNNPRLWWCNGLGNPNLYRLSLQYLQNNITSDTTGINFGIRQIEAFKDEQGAQGYKLNGQKVLIKGAGWTDEIFLRDTKASNETQIQYVKHMNLNTIRLESVWGNDQSLYDLCDRYGIMMMVGWSCQWEWENYLGKKCDEEFGGIETREEMKLISGSLVEQVKWLRHHPSIIAWFVGSDKIPRPELETEYKALLGEYDNRSYLAAASMKRSSVSGFTGVKMNGPYEYVAPDYWYEDKDNGGAFGFNTETTPGPQIPAKETILKMIPQEKLWPLGPAWNSHCTSALEAFNTLDVFNNVLSKRYGTPTSLDDYLLKSNLMQYEAIGAMFEAFRVNVDHTTGIVQWKLNSAWPSFYWQLYDYYLLPTASYYAVRKANQPLQLMFVRNTNKIFAVNETRTDRKKYKAKIAVYTRNGREILNQTVPLKLSALKSEVIEVLPTFKELVFISLWLLDENGAAVSDNFYWISPVHDEFDWKKTEWFYTPLKSFADFSALNDMPGADVAVSMADLKNRHLTVKLENKSKALAFFNTLTLVNSKEEQLFPVLWDDNYFSLVPGEVRIITARLPEGMAPSKLILTGANSKVVAIKF